MFKKLFFIFILFCSSFATAKISLENISVSIITEKLNQPWSLAVLPDGRFLVTEKNGNLRLVDKKGNISKPLSGLPDVAVIGQGGLLDVVLHPNFTSNRWIYLSFVAGSSVRGYSTEVVRATLDKNQLKEVKKIFVAQPKTKGGRHFGSRLLFDKQNYLYISLGDRGLRSPSQDLSNHIGSLIRLHDDGKIPEDNPFLNHVDAKPEIFSYGHRNIQGLALHPLTGEVWAHEHGPQGGDEFNHIISGKNYGWPVITYGKNYVTGTSIGEGTHKTGMVQPKYIWTPSIAPSGLAFYKDYWLVGALKYQLIALLDSSDPNLKEQRILEREYGRIRDLRVHNNEIYVLTDSSKGKLLQLHIQ